MIDQTAWAFFRKWAAEQNISSMNWLNWRKRGVPYKHRLLIHLAAEKRGFEIDLNAYDQCPAHES